MTKILYGSVFVFALLCLTASPSRADIDQRCLSLCVSGGGSGQSCLPQCTYDKQPQAQSPAPAQMGTSHNVLVAPQPAGDTIVLPPPAPVKAAADKDYACVAQCLKNGEQYRQCSESCTKTSCSTGATQCRDLLGMTPPTALAGTAIR